MSNTSSQLIKILGEQKERLYEKWEGRLTEFCKELVRYAVEERLSDPSAHNYTGNLINSIVVMMFREGQFTHVFEAGVRQPITYKMSGPTKYHFTVDWDGAESNYEAEVTTNRGFGNADAYEFSHRYKANPNAIFEIVLAYPVEYAEFVENLRGTVGYAAMWEYVRHLSFEKVVSSDDRNIWLF